MMKKVQDALEFLLFFSRSQSYSHLLLLKILDMVSVQGKKLAKRISSMQQGKQMPIGSLNLFPRELIQLWERGVRCCQVGLWISILTKNKNLKTCDIGWFVAVFKIRLPRRCCWQWLHSCVTGIIKTQWQSCFFNYLCNYPLNVLQYLNVTNSL